jgi:hypothetical protein
MYQNAPWHLGLTAFFVALLASILTIIIAIITKGNYRLMEESYSVSRLSFNKEQLKKAVVLNPELKPVNQFSEVHPKKL